MLVDFHPNRTMRPSWHGATGRVRVPPAQPQHGAPPNSDTLREETMGTVHRQPGGGGAMGGPLQAIWRYKWLITAAVLLGALLGYGWAARQPTLYEGVSRMAMDCPLNAQCAPLRSRAQLLRSPAVLEHAVKLSGNRISAETLGQHLQVEVAPDTDVVTIRVVDSTAKGAAQLADSVMLASDQVVARQQARKVAEQLRWLEARCELENTLANDVVESAGRPNDDRLRNKCDAATLAQLWEARRRLLLQLDAAEGILRERAAAPKQPIQPRPRRPIAIGMLFGLLVSAVLVWWLTHRHGPTSSAPEQGPELPSPA
jgi:capsular polysaccharide biosynthesis protein